MHRYKIAAAHYVSPTEDNRYQAAKMKAQGIFREVYSDVGEIIVAEVDTERVAELLDPSQEALERLISKADRRATT